MRGRSPLVVAKQGRHHPRGCRGDGRRWRLPRALLWHRLGMLGLKAPPTWRPPPPLLSLSLSFALAPAGCRLGRRLQHHFLLLALLIDELSHVHARPSGVQHPRQFRPSSLGCVLLRFPEGLAHHACAAVVAPSLLSAMILLKILVASVTSRSLGVLLQVVLNSQNCTRGNPLVPVPFLHLVNCGSTRPTRLVFAAAGGISARDDPHECLRLDFVAGIFWHSWRGRPDGRR